MGKCLISMIAVAICLSSLVMGCFSHIQLVPGKILPLDTKPEGLAGPFDHITVNLVNAQTDDSNYSVKDWKGRNSLFLLNRKLWSEKLVEALGAELMARHGKVVDRAPVTLSLKVTEVTYPFPREFKINFDATAEVTSNLGWKKTYVGKGDAANPPFSSVTENRNRAANYMITDLVRIIMSDPELTAELNRKNIAAAPPKAATTAPAPAAPVSAAPVKMEKLSGKIKSVDAKAKSIVVGKGKVEKTFVVDEKAKITKGKTNLILADLKATMSVLVEYKMEGSKMIAMAIKVVVPQGAPKASTTGK